MPLAASIHRKLYDGPNVESARFRRFAPSNESTPMQHEISVRPTVSEDLQAIAQVADATELFPGHMIRDMTSGYLNGSKPDLWFTAATGGKPIAFAFCEPERMTNGTWNLLAIGVAPDHQSQGIGANMMRHLETELRRAGHRILLVETLGTPEFERARAFYLRNAFTEEARIRDFYEAGGDKVIFWKQL